MPLLNTQQAAMRNASANEAHHLEHDRRNAMTARERTQRRRAKVRRLHAEGLGVREIARLLHVDPSTVSRDLKVPAPDGPPPPPKGNQRNRRHGAYSEAAIAPVREQVAARLAAEYPWVAADEIALQAQRLAQLQLAASYVDDNGVVRDDGGRVFDVADKLTSWSAAAERWYDRARQARPDGWRHADDPAERAEREARVREAADPVAVTLARALAGRTGPEILASEELSGIARDLLRHVAAQQAAESPGAPRGAGRSHKRRGEPAPTAGALEGDEQLQLNPGPLDPDPFDPLGGLRDGR